MKLGIAIQDLFFVIKHALHLLTPRIYNLNLNQRTLKFQPCLQKLQSETKTQKPHPPAQAGQKVADRLQKVRPVQNVGICTALNYILPQRQVLPRKVLERFRFEEVNVAVLRVHSQNFPMVRSLIFEL